MFVVDKSGRAKKIGSEQDIKNLKWPSDAQCRILDESGKTIMKKINKSDFKKKFM
jgi:hypothetical protein